MFRALDGSRDSGVEKRSEQIQLPRELADKKFGLQQEIGKEIKDMETWRPLDRALEALCFQAALLRDGKINTSTHNLSEGPIQVVDLKGLKAQIENFNILAAKKDSKLSENAQKKVKEFTEWLFTWTSGQSDTLDWTQ